MAERAQLVPQYDSEGRAQFVRQYFDDSVETTASADDFDSAIGTAAVTDEFTSTPTITITPYDPGEVTGWLNVYIRVSGVDGKTPDFALSFADFRAENDVPQNAPWGMVWRYVDDATVPSDGRPRPWSTFDNNSGNVSHTFSNSSAFTSDDIEIAIKPRWRYLDTQRAVAYVESSGMAVELDSSIAASGLPTHVHDQFTHSGTTSNTATATAINMYAVGVDDTSVSPAGGEDKLNFVLIPGQHASEDQGNDTCWETVLFYLDGTGTIADWFRQHCRLFVYDANPQGRYYGRERWTDETASDEDPNRAWDDSASEQINAVKTAMGMNLARTDVFWDYHGDYRLSGNGLAAEYGIFATYTTEGQWRTRVNAIVSPLTVADLGTAPTGSAQKYGNDVLSAQLSSTLEFPIAPPGFPDPETSYQALLSDYIEAVKDMVAADELTLTSLATNIGPGIGSIAMSGLAASLLAPANLAPDLATTALSGIAVDLNAAADIQPDVGALSLAGNDTALESVSNISAGQGSMALAGSDVELADFAQLDPAAGAMAMNGENLSVDSPANIQPGAGSYALNGQAVSLLSSVEIAPDVGVSALAGFDMDLLADVDIVAGVGSLSLNGFAVSVEDEQAVSISPETGSMAIAGEIVGLTAVSDLTPGIGSLALSAQAVDLTTGFTISPSLASITCAGIAVSLDAAALLSPGLADITLVGQNATIELEENISAGAAILSLVGEAVDIESAVTLNPSIYGVVLSGLEASVTYTTAIAVDSGLLSLEGQDFSFFETLAIQPNIATLSFSGMEVVLTAVVFDSVIVTTAKIEQSMVSGRANSRFVTAKSKNTIVTAIKEAT